MAANLIDILDKDDIIRRLIERISEIEPGERAHFSGIVGSFLSLVVAALSASLMRQILVVERDRDGAEKLHDDLSVFLDPSTIGVFGGTGHTPSHSPEHGKVTNDVHLLRRLLAGDARVTVTSPDGLSLHIPSPNAVRRQSFDLEVGKNYSFDQILKALTEFNFEKKDFVESVGDYAVRGGILDVYPFVGDNPVRLEMFGDEVESIREFDPMSQRSICQLTAATIVPNILIGSEPSTTGSSGSSTILDFIDHNSVLVFQDIDLIRAAFVEGEFTKRPGRMSWDSITPLLDMFPQINVLPVRSAQPHVLDVGTKSQPSFNGSVKMLKENLARLHADGYRTIITCDSNTEISRLRELLDDRSAIEQDATEVVQVEDFDQCGVELSHDALHEGFVYPAGKIAVYTEHQIFGRLKRRGKKQKPKFRGLGAKELQQLRRGDYVVHVDYGIGRFAGLKKIKVGGVEQEVVQLLYEEKDILYVHLNFINKVQKFSSKEGHTPKLTKLGTAEWDRLKSRTKSRVKDIARDLIKLYAQRKSKGGFSFPKDTIWQRELEASFIYEDTFDQARASLDIKSDMESPHPMDRLICGDVGFGKTEIAVRAAFKAVMGGKQVAVLVPTTILALQHFNTFVDRLGKYSTNIKVLSRLNTKKEQSTIIEMLKAGSVDIVIGTHRLLSKDVGFKNLGLLTIDEEHRFGVSSKEKLRQLSATVDTLTLTATPIPRTLHFSLLGARDLSIIATPPRNRLPVITEIAQYSPDLVRGAVLREIQRGGQIYFVHDRVSNIEEMTTQLKMFLPGVRIRFAHGQMHAHELEKAMLEFLERRCDVLVATKIIESGLDIPNVNTILINRADRFGLAELYQLRGRVGRSNVQAYSYLLTPPIDSLPRSTVMRLQAVEEFTELGSGFNLAMRDMEIRGTGNLLGGEQSGFIDSIGFEMYTRILEEAVSELKQDEFKNLFTEIHKTDRAKDNIVVEADFDVLIPDTYIENDTERLAVYRRLYAVVSNQQVDEIAAELEDRFGLFGDEVSNLLKIVKIRLLAGQLGFRRANISTGNLNLDFPPESEEAFYQSEKFQRIMSFVSNGKKDMFLDQKENQLRLRVKLTQRGEHPLTGSESMLSEMLTAAKPTTMKPRKKTESI